MKFISRERSLMSVTGSTLVTSSGTGRITIGAATLRSSPEPPASNGPSLQQRRDTTRRCDGRRPGSPNRPRSAARRCHPAGSNISRSEQAGPEDREGGKTWCLLSTTQLRPGCESLQLGGLERLLRTCSTVIPQAADRA